MIIPATTALQSPGEIVDYMKVGKIELPVYDPATVAWNYTALTQTIRAGELSTMTRYARLNNRMGIVLEDILPAADATLNRFAKKCGATVIAHHWGLSKPAPDTPYGYTSDVPLGHRDLPSDTALVAQIEIIRNSSFVPTALQETVKRIIREEESDPTIPYIWDDAKPNAFRTTDKGVYLVDIEPFIKPVAN